MITELLRRCGREKRKRRKYRKNLQLDECGGVALEDEFSTSASDRLKVHQVPHRGCPPIESMRKTKRTKK